VNPDKARTRRGGDPGRLRNVRVWACATQARRLQYGPSPIAKKGELLLSELDHLGMTSEHRSAMHSLRCSRCRKHGIQCVMIR
jgi:hypothetical protein